MPLDSVQTPEVFDTADTKSVGIEPMLLVDYLKLRLLYGFWESMFKLHINNMRKLGRLFTSSLCSLENTKASVAKSFAILENYSLEEAN